MLCSISRHTDDTHVLMLANERALVMTAPKTEGSRVILLMHWRWVVYLSFPLMGRHGGEAGCILTSVRHGLKSRFRLTISCFLILKLKTSAFDLKNIREGSENYIKLDKMVVAKETKG